MRLPRWLRRTRPTPAVGRHSRVLAAAPVAAPDTTAVPDAPAAPDVVLDDPMPAPESASTEAAASVRLGFADGATVDLDPDDPRVRTFRAAAAALLDAPRA